MRFCNLYFTLSTTPPGVGTVSLREYSADNKEAGRKGPQHATILTSAFDTFFCLFRTELFRSDAARSLPPINIWQNTIDRHVCSLSFTLANGTK